MNKKFSILKIKKIIIGLNLGFLLFALAIFTNFLFFSNNAKISDVNAQTSNTVECTFNLNAGYYSSGCYALKGAPASGNTWSCYNNKCVQEPVSVCKLNGVSCGCDENALKAEKCNANNAGQVVVGRCSYCHNAFATTCPNPQTYTCYKCNPTNWSITTVTQNQPCSPTTNTFSDPNDPTLKAQCTAPQISCSKCEVDSQNVNKKVTQVFTNTAVCPSGWIPQTQAVNLVCSNTCYYCNKTNPDSWTIGTKPQVSCDPAKGEYYKQDQVLNCVAPKTMACTANPSKPANDLTVGASFEVSLGSASNAASTPKLVSDTATICSVEGTNKLNLIKEGECKYHVEWSKASSNVTPDKVNCPNSFIVKTPTTPGLSISKVLKENNLNTAAYDIKVTNTGNVAINDILVVDKFDATYFVYFSSSLHTGIEYKTESNVKYGYATYDKFNLNPGETKVINMVLMINDKATVDVKACNLVVNSSGNYTSNGQSKPITSQAVNNNNEWCIDVPKQKGKLVVSLTKTNVTANKVKVDDIVNWQINSIASCPKIVENGVEKDTICDPINAYKFEDSYPTAKLLIQSLKARFIVNGVEKSQEILKDCTKNGANITCTIVPSGNGVSYKVEDSKFKIIINNVLDYFGGVMSTGDRFIFEMSTKALEKSTDQVVNTVTVTTPNNTPTASGNVLIDAKTSVIGIDVEELPKTSDAGTILGVPMNSVIASLVALISASFGFGLVTILKKDKSTLFKFK